MRLYKNAEQERINRTIAVDENTDEEKIKIQEKLKNARLDAEIGADIYSEELNENGNIYIIDGIELEIYIVEPSKIASLANNQINGVTTIQGENGIEKEGLIIGSIVVMNCENEEMQDKLIEALSEENYTVTPFSNTNEYSE